MMKALVGNQNVLKTKALPELAAAIEASKGKMYGKKAAPTKNYKKGYYGA